MDPKTSVRNQKGMTLIWFYLLIAVLVTMSGSLYAVSFQQARMISMEQARNQAFYKAEAGLDAMLQALRFTSPTPSSVTAPDGTYTAVYDPASGKVTAKGLAAGTSRTIEATVAKGIPVGVRAAISAVWTVDLNGSIRVDGRDHNAKGELNGDPGTFGISSGGDVNQGGNSYIGGNGIAPGKPANAETYEENATDNVFSTPEAVLGLAAGSLDQYKTATPPPTPFKGIVYLTADSWIAPDFGTEDEPSTGILIVHNASGNAFIKNLHGHFKGLIIADDLIHIDGDAEIIGAVVLEKATGNVVGNGDADVKYSWEVLSNLPLANYSIVSWEDQLNG